MKIIAHRGNNLDKVENNISGILNSLNYDYIDGVEIDVRMTLDNKIVICHDLIIKTINNEFKILQKERLNNLRKETFIKSKKKYKINKLESLLKKIKTDKLIIIECKLEMGNINKFVKSILKVLKKYKNLNILLCSFNYDLATKLKSRYKKVGLLIGYKININKNKNFDYLLVSSSYNNDLSVPYFVWTINSINNYNKIMEINKNSCFLGIITDKSYIFKGY